MTLNGTWGYSKFDDNWKSAAQLIHTLVETTSKNGNFLLNVGPDGTGVIPSGSVDRLKEVGQWMAENGASIYGCEASTLPQPKWGRMTAKGSKLYLHVFNWPAEGQLMVEKFTGAAKKVYLLADSEKRALTFKSSGDALVISVPSQAPSALDSVVVLEL